MAECDNNEDAPNPPEQPKKTREVPIPGNPPLTDVFLARVYSKEKQSISAIAKMCGVCPKTVRNYLRKYSIPIHSASAIQKANIKKRGHPSQGMKRSAETRRKIAESVAAAWRKMPERQRKYISRKQRANYFSISDEERQALQKAATEGTRRAAESGSRIEHYLMMGLRSNGYEVQFHKEYALAGSEGVHLDMYLPVLKTAIEIDGKSHFQPIFGEEALAKRQEYDRIKNGLVLNAGFCLIRVRITENSFSQHRGNKYLEKILEVLGRIRDAFPPPEERLIHISLE